MQIGRKIYYEKLTGTVLVDTGERNGDVVETTIDQDFEMYTNLQGYVVEQVECKQLDYGQYVEQFQSCYGYKINPTTLEIVFNNIPPMASLSEAQTAKISELNSACNTEILEGFEYTQNGTIYLIGFDEQDQSNLTQQMVLLPVSAEPIMWKVKGQLLFLQFTKDEFLQLGLVAKNHKESKMQKYFTLCGQVQMCTDIAGVDAIVW